MSSIVNFLRKVYPDFAQARKSRREIRQQYRKNLKALDREDDVSLVMTTDNETGYLTRRAEKAAVDVDHLIKKHGSRSDPYFYRITSNDEIVEESFNEAIKKIDRRNILSYIVEIFFVVFVILIFSFSISIGAYGVENIIEWLI